MENKGKWPCTIKITKVSESKLNDGLTLYLITGVMNKNQAETISEKIGIASTIQIEEDLVSIVILLSKTQLLKLNEIFEPLSRSWRGQYQAITKEFTRAYQEEAGNDI
jgi:hypothetical protein